MKKRTQIIVLAAAVCIALGGVLMGAGVAAGGREQIAAGHFVFVNGRGAEQMVERLWEEDGWHHDVHITRSASDIPDIPDVPDVPDVPDISDIGGVWKGQEEESGQEVLSGDFERTITVGGIPQNLKVTLGVHSLSIVESDEERLFLAGENCDRVQCYVKKDTLYIKDVGKNKKYKNVNSRTLTLFVPEEAVWEEAEINAELGSVEIDRLDGRKVELDADLGQITIDTLYADKLEIDADLGGVEVSDGYAETAEFSASMGSIQYTGMLGSDVEAEAEMGSIEMNLSQAESDFDFEINASMGSIEVNGVDNSYSYSGMDKKKKINNGAGRKMELETSMGSIVIFFE